MERSDRLCVGCGAPSSEHDGRFGPCERTGCKEFNDPYYAFNESIAPEPPAKLRDEEVAYVPPPQPGLTDRVWAWIMAHPIYTGLTLVALFLIAVFIFR